MCISVLVTLHVSVWVEITPYPHIVMWVVVTLHVSVWVEICVNYSVKYLGVQSRSTWACELKYQLCERQLPNSSHAPRERVSWNSPEAIGAIAAQVTLHVSVWVEIQRFTGYRKGKCVTLHVSVWVEMISTVIPSQKTYVTLHVSVWVEIQHTIILLKATSVTLHVSVWVEISIFSNSKYRYWSRSTWACELKSL